MHRVSILTLIIGALVIVILLTFAFTYQVAFYEAAVKVTLGKADENSVITTPGLKFRWPWPVERIERYDTRLCTTDTPETEIKTIDGKNLIIGTYAVWRIKDPLQFYNRVRTVPRAEDQMRTRLGQVQAAVVGQRTLADFVNLDRDLVEKNYDQFFQQMRDQVAQGLSDDYGIEIVAIGMRRPSLPKEVTQEIFNSMSQERKALAARYREEGKSRAEAIKARARSEADAILSFADTKAGEIRAIGVQASTRILAKIQESDREFFEWLRWLDTLKASLSQKTTIFIDKDWPLFKPFVQPPVPAEALPK